MKILFLCTAHNSLSQRLFLELSGSGHDVSIELALSDETMTAAVILFKPDLVICPFLTSRVPEEVYNKVLTLIIHPGPPGDAGPSALDWLLMGDTGSIDDSSRLLKSLKFDNARLGRTHWGVTVIQAVEDFDAGPVWAFEQFPVDIDQPGLTKSELYRGAVTRAAVTATKAAISRVQQAIKGRRPSALVMKSSHYTPCLRADPAYARLSVTNQLPFQGGKTFDRPLLKAAQRDFDVKIHTAVQISRCIRSADSQPGVLSTVFGAKLYVYGGAVEDNAERRQSSYFPNTATRILGVRNGAICISTCDSKGIWITHVRRPKTQVDASLWPKVPATMGLVEMGVLSNDLIEQLEWPLCCGWTAATSSTLQDIWVEFDVDENAKRTAYLYFDFYNGAMSTNHCSRLIKAMDYILSESTSGNPIHAVALMGGTYFSYGIALNVAEADIDPAGSSWLNINRINDVVHHILHEFPSRGILTIAAMRGNAAAGGVALATACDIVIAGSEIVLNPAYRAIGLSGSEYHTLSYPARCGKKIANKLLRSMVPLSPIQAQRTGLVDYVFPGNGEQLEDYMRTHITMLLQPNCLKHGFWKAAADLSVASLASVRATELGEMSKDFWSPRSVRYNVRRFDFVRKVKPLRTPLRFAKHRRLSAAPSDIEETEQFDSVDYFRDSAEAAMIAKLREQIREEMGTLSRPIAVAHPAPNAVVAVVGSGAARKGDTLFSCYYAPSNEPLTPPATPLDACVAVQGSFFGHIEAACT